MRYCGVDISAKPGNQQLVTLHERRAPAGGVELVATFYAPGTVEQVARTIRGFGRGEVVVAVDAPSGPRLDLLAAGAPLRAELGLPDGRYERMRVCDALLYRRGLPLYPVPAKGVSPPGWEQWIGVGFELFAALADLGVFRPDTPAARSSPSATPRCASAGSARPIRTRSSAALLGHRPSPKRTPWGLQQRIAALKLKGVEDADGGLWHRTLDELDACAAAYTAYALAAGLGLWVGDARGGRHRAARGRAPDALREAPAARALGARLGDRTYTGGSGEVPVTAARPSPGHRPAEGRAREAARVSSSARCPRAISRSSRSCCAPPASPSSAS